MRKTLLTTIAGIAAVLLTIGVFVVVVDPYQQYHGSDKYINDQRLELAGVARHHDCTILLTGSSMAMNHDPEQVDSVYADFLEEGEHALNYSIMGAHYDDYEVMLSYALRLGKTRLVILDLDYFSFQKPQNTVCQYLYNDTRLDDYEYLYNYTTLKNCVVKLTHPFEVKGLYHFSSLHGEQKVIECYESEVNDRHFADGMEFENMRRLFDQSLLSIVREFSGKVKWQIYFPPYSSPYFAVCDYHGCLDDILQFRAYAAETLSKIEGVSVYDFQTDSTWICDYDEFMDTKHHSHSYSHKIIECLHADTMRFEPDTDKGDERMRELVRGWQRRHNGQGE